MKNFLKNISGTISIILLFLAILLLFSAIRGLRTNRPVNAYQDEGVHTFLPYEVTTKSREVYYRHRATTQNTYRLHYRSTDASRYKYVQNVSSRSIGNQKIKDKEAIMRRVLSIPAENKHVTIPPEDTIESYVQQNIRRTQLYFVISLVYIGSYCCIWGIRKHLHTCPQS